uniref:Uncharacterized protein n=1 Tax=Leptospira santarosai serovar Arenal str. MAVJ 401 TaxID=1049976 RepID=M6JJK7_9LEPT|nr:hypothetical protein LEP1GSC063_3556 [Leptospira santarosai serovar Arenal str. MAVJ 401]
MCSGVNSQNIPHFGIFQSFITELVPSMWELLRTIIVISIIANRNKKLRCKKSFQTAKGMDRLRDAICGNSPRFVTNLSKVVADFF